MIITKRRFENNNKFIALPLVFFPLLLVLFTRFITWLYIIRVELYVALSYRCLYNFKYIHFVEYIVVIWLVFHHSISYAESSTYYCFT